MDQHLADFLRELERFGAENDSRVRSREEKMLNITPETGPFLVLLIRAVKATRVLEIGTSNGYSTLWLAHGVEPLGGTVTTVELSPFKAAIAQKNFTRARLEPLISMELTDAGEFFLKQPDGTFDFLFLDSYRTEYPQWWPEIQRVLARGALVVCDNAVTHSHEFRDFHGLVSETPGYITSTVPVGHGQLLILKGS